MTVLSCTLQCMKNKFTRRQGWIFNKTILSQVLFWLTIDWRVQFTTPYHPPRQHPPAYSYSKKLMLCHAFNSSLDGCHVTKIYHPISLAISNRGTQYSAVQTPQVVIIKLNIITQILCTQLETRQELRWKRRHIIFAAWNVIIRSSVWSVCKEGIALSH